jgi:hypothetical protein
MNDYLTRVDIFIEINNQNKAKVIDEITRYYNFKILSLSP